MTDLPALLIQNTDRDFFFIGRLGFEVIIKNRPFWWVITDRSSTINLVGEVQTGCRTGLKKVEVIIRDPCAGLAQRIHVIENPECSAMRGRNQIAVLDSKIVNRNDGQIQLQRLPVCAIVDGEIDASLG